MREAQFLQGAVDRVVRYREPELLPIRLVALAVALQHCPARGVSFGRLLDLQLAAIEWTLGATADSPEARVNEGPSGSAAGNRLRAISRGLEWAFRLYPGPTMASASTRTVTAINEDRAHTIRS